MLAVVSRSTIVIQCRLLASRSPSFLLAFGGDERNRTADPLLAKQVLSHLSYIPRMILDGRLNIPNRRSKIRHVGGGPSWDRTRDLTLIKRAL